MRPNLSCLFLLLGCVGRAHGSDPENPPELAKERSIATPAPLGTCEGYTGPSNPFASSMEVVLVASNLRGAEGPVWVDGSLYFTDLDGEKKNWAEASSSRIMKFEVGAAPLVFLNESGSNGLAVDSSGTLWAAAHDLQAVVVIDLTTMERKPVVSTYNGAPFNSPNDLAVRSDGNVYFSDPDWQRGRFTNGTGRPGQPTTSVFRIAPDGTVSVVDSTLREPNGVTLSRSGSRLYVTTLDADTTQGAGKVWRYTLDADGAASEGEIFVDHPGPWLDGMTIDCADNLYVTGGAGVEVYDPSGVLLGVIADTGRARNVAFGGTDGRTLFVTTISEVYSVRLPVSGWPY